MQPLTGPLLRVECPNCGATIDVQVRLEPIKMVGEQVTANCIGTYEHTCKS